MYDHELKVYGQYLAEAQALPQNTSADGNGAELDLFGVQGGVEIVAKVNEELALADTKTASIKLQHKDVDGAYEDLATIYSVTADGATTVDADTVLGRFVVPSSTKRGGLKAVLTTDDAAADGSVDIYPRMLAR